MRRSGWAVMVALWGVACGGRVDDEKSSFNAGPSGGLGGAADRGAAFGGAAGGASAAGAEGGSDSASGASRAGADAGGAQTGGATTTDRCRYTLQDSVVLDPEIGDRFVPTVQPGYAAIRVTNYVQSLRRVYDLEFSLLDTAGQLVSRTTPYHLAISPNGGLDNGSVDVIDMTQLGDGLGLIWWVSRNSAPSSLMYARVGPDGTAQGQPVELLAAALVGTPRLLVADDRLGALWENGAAFHFLPLGRDGTVLGPEVTFAAPRLAYGTTAFWSEDHFDLFWSDYLPALSEFHRVSIDRDGHPIDGPLLLSDPDMMALCEGIAATDAGYIAAVTAINPERQWLWLLDRRGASVQKTDLDAPIYRLASRGTELGAVLWNGSSLAFTTVAFDGTPSAQLLPFPGAGGSLAVDGFYWHQTGFGIFKGCESPNETRECYIQIRCDR
jgi:hypothetical protein